MKKINTDIFKPGNRYKIDGSCLVDTGSSYLIMAKYCNTYADQKRMIMQCAIMNAGFKYDPTI